MSMLVLFVFQQHILPIIFPRRQIFTAYLSCTTPIGYGFQEVLDVLKQGGVHITFDQLVRGVQELCDAGRLYTTTDEEHYLTTGSE
jgi:hypothetical protein